MSSRAKLYIRGQEVDTQGDNLLLFTYTASELDAPAVVRNSYSRSITLPPTPTNNKLFGHYWRLDKSESGLGFSALAREPFEIRANGDEVLESGYVKLDSASEESGYTITLYGGLGGFLYGLMYAEDGGKKSLADLWYIENTDTELDFKITAANVQAAWNYLANTDRSNPLWGVINFAPMRNGIPKDFSADKGMVTTGTAGTRAVTDYTDTNGYTLMNFGKDYDEWEVRDLRCYLQRPVFKLSAMMNAIADSTQNGGYTFDWSAVANGLPEYLSLPMLAVNTNTKDSGTLTATWNTSQITTGGSIPITLSGMPANYVKSSVNLLFNVLLFPSATMSAAYMRNVNKVTGSYTTTSDLFLFVQAVAYNSSNVAVGGSSVYVIADEETWDDSNVSLNGVINGAGYTPTYATTAYKQVSQGALTTDGNDNWLTDTLSMSVSGYGISYISIYVTGVERKFRTSNNRSYYYTSQSDLELATARATTNGSLTDISVFQIIEVEGSSYTYEGAASLRSGATFTKQDLLGGTHSPAEYLLGLCKAFGWVMRYDGISKTITLMNRDDYYTGDVVDLTGRIDQSAGHRPKVVPNAIEARWLDFAFEDIGSRYGTLYEKKWGVPYGMQRVNTSSPFNQDHEAVLDGTPFRQGVVVAPYGRYFYQLQDSGTGEVLPPPCLDNNVTYTLYAEDGGEATDFDAIRVSNDISITSIQYEYEGELWQIFGQVNGYDTYLRQEMEDADRNEVDGADVLLECSEWNDENVHLSDDLDEMYVANDGLPCWQPIADDSTMRLPVFLSWATSENYTVDVANDMGQPREIDVPHYPYYRGSSIYDRRWKAYIEDRYSDNARVCTARVDFRGMRVGQDLFRSFYWFGGALWALNKIKDYCYDNPTLTECEFVRVQDTAAYTDGQSVNRIID